jgi:hypothetical protein
MNFKHHTNKYHDKIVVLQQNLSICHFDVKNGINNLL